jgi:hypothetical protein
MGDTNEEVYLGVSKREQKEYLKELFKPPHSWIINDDNIRVFKNKLSMQDYIRRQATQQELDENSRLIQVIVDIFVKKLEKEKKENYEASLLIKDNNIDNNIDCNIDNNIVKNIDIDIDNILNDNNHDSLLNEIDNLEINNNLIDNIDMNRERNSNARAIINSDKDIDNNEQINELSIDIFIDKASIFHTITGKI